MESRIVANKFRHSLITYRSSVLRATQVFVILILSACGKSAGTIPAPTQTLTSTIAPTNTSIPTPTEEPTLTSSGAISSLEYVSQALIQIRSTGAFQDPDNLDTGFVSGLGSGFILDPSGLAVTNNHVVTGADRIEVIIGENQENPHSATLLGGLICSDLAVIDIDGEGYAFLDWSTQEIDFGQEIFSGGFEADISAVKLSNGIVVNESVDGNTPWTAVDHLFGYSIRADPKYSGSAVLDNNGSILGVNYGLQYQEMNNVGISSNIARDMVESLIHNSWLGSFGINGVAYIDGEETGGVWVISVQPGSAADRAGLRPGDLITRLDGDSLASDRTLSTFCKILQDHDPSDLLPFEILRTSSGEILVGELSSSTEAAYSTPYPPGITPVAGVTPGPNEVVNADASQPGEIYYDLLSTIQLPDWNQFVTGGDPGGVVNTFENGKNLVEIGSLYTYNYYIYEGLEVSDVQLEVEIENQGVNNSLISLICRYSEEGWYEFNISSNGLFYIYRYSPTEKNPYVKLWSGGSREINLGKEVNNYISICDENRLTLKINGKEKITVKDSNLSTGNIGFAISSNNRIPVVVNINKFTASVPE